MRQAVSGGASITSCSFKMAGDESGATLGQPHLARQDLNSLVSLDFLYILWSLYLTCPRRIVVFLLNVAVQRPELGWGPHTSRHPALDAMAGGGSEGGLTAPLFLRYCYHTSLFSNISLLSTDVFDVMSL